MENRTMSDNTASKTLNAVARDAVGGPVIPPLINLFEITVNPPKTARSRSQTLYRFVAADMAADGVTFAGNRFQAYPVQVQGFVWSVDGPPVRPSLELANLSGLFSAAVEADVLRGAGVRRILTLASELAPPEGENGGACFPPEEWVIDRVARLDRQIVRLELTALASLEGQYFPPRVMLRDICQHRYRRWDHRKNAFDYEDVTCPYTGRHYFTAEGSPTSKPAEDVCGLRLDSGCAKRFAGIKPFLGFPGITRL